MVRTGIFSGGRNCSRMVNIVTFLVKKNIFRVGENSGIDR
jgi:hypothetical protein